MREGSFSPRTLNVFPTLTGTAHTALVTGAGAFKHGILGNNKFDASTWVYRDDNPDNYSSRRFVIIPTSRSARCGLRLTHEGCRPRL